MTPELRSKVERFYLESQKELELGLEADNVPTADQLIMGMLDIIPRPLTYDEIDFMVRKMVMRLTELQDQPKVLYTAAFERFCKFVLEQCDVEMMILAFARLKHHEVRNVETPSYVGVLEITKEFVG